MNYLYYASIAIYGNFLIAGIYLFYLKRGNYFANKLFGTILLLNVYVNVIMSLYIFQKFPFGTLNVQCIYYPVEFAIPPLFFFYFITLIKTKIDLNKTVVLHFIPTICLLLIGLLYFLLPLKDKLILTIFSQGNLKILYLLTATFYIQFSAYLFVIMAKVFKNPEILNNKEANNFTLKKQESELMIIVVIVFLMSFAAVLIVPQNIIYAPVLNAIAYYLILYVILFKPGMLLHSQTIHAKGNNNNKMPVKSYKLEEENMLIEKIINLITIEKIYLDNHISLNGLADKIQVPYYQLSRIINHTYNQNFSDFINSMRVEEAKKKLLDANYKRLTIEAIGQSVGFNSKSSFYIAFKKYAHCSPKEYMKTNSNNQMIWLYNRTV